MMNWIKNIDFKDTKTQIIIAIIGGVWLTGAMYSFFILLFTGQLLPFLIFGTPLCVAFCALMVYAFMQVEW